MTIKTTTTRGWLTLAAALGIAGSVAPLARADTVICWDGRSYEGRIVNAGRDRVIVDVAGGRVCIWREDIARVLTEGERAEVAANSADQAAVSYLVGIATDRAETAEARCCAIRTLGSTGGHQSLYVLVGLLSDPAPEVQSEARSAFVRGARAPLSPDIVALLEKQARSESKSVRVGAVRCLGTGDPACDSALAAALAIDPEADVRLTALDGLVRSGSRVARAAITRALHDPVETVRAAAASALKRPWPEPTAG